MRSDCEHACRPASWLLVLSTPRLWEARGRAGELIITFPFCNSHCCYFSTAMRRKGVSFPTASSAAPASELSGLICSHFCYVTVMLVSPENTSLVTEGVWLHQRRGNFWFGYFYFFLPSLQILRDQFKGGLGC